MPYLDIFLFSLRWILINLLRKEFICLKIKFLGNCYYFDFYA